MFNYITDDVNISLDDSDRENSDYSDEVSIKNRQV